MTRTKSRLRKIHCPGCGAILYGSATALRKAMSYTRQWEGPEGSTYGLRCGCGQTFIATHLEDREAIENANERKEQ